MSRDRRGALREIRDRVNYSLRVPHDSAYQVAHVAVLLPLPFIRLSPSMAMR